MTAYNEILRIAAQARSHEPKKGRQPPVLPAPASISLPAVQGERLSSTVPAFGI